MATGEATEAAVCRGGTDNQDRRSSQDPILTDIDCVKSHVSVFYIIKSCEHVLRTRNPKSVAAFTSSCYAASKQDARESSSEVPGLAR